VGGDDIYTNSHFPSLIRSAKTLLATTGSHVQTGTVFGVERVGHCTDIRVRAVVFNSEPSAAYNGLHCSFSNWREGGGEPKKPCKR
jgi:hypothetical protein